MIQQLTAFYVNDEAKYAGEQAAKMMTK